MNCNISHKLELFLDILQMRHINDITVVDIFAAYKYVLHFHRTVCIPKYFTSLGRVSLLFTSIKMKIRY